VARSSNPYSAWGYGFDEPLEPDRCRHDRCAPCRYWHRKELALAGYQLPDEDARFVRVGITSTSPTDGWQTAHFPPDTVADPPGLSASDTALLQHLMAVDVSVSMSAFLGPDGRSLAATSSSSPAGDDRFRC
jgi:hypothetical protein